MHSNSQFSVDISKFYARELLPKSSIIVDEDYYIENARAEINIRIGQSKFRNGVLKNFDFKCALSGISEINLLRASHIIPWSHKNEFRADISNGICLYAEYDALFDEGYISFTDELETLICGTKFTSKLLTEKLNPIKGKKLSTPRNKNINEGYLEYHRTKIFKQ